MQQVNDRSVWHAVSVCGLLSVVNSRCEDLCSLVLILVWRRNTLLLAVVSEKEKDQCSPKRIHKQSCHQSVRGIRKRAVFLQLHKFCTRITI